jgi:hypothetical protein
MDAITKKDLLIKFGEDAVEDCEAWIADHFLSGIDYAVLISKTAHHSLKNLFCSKDGDEDWIVLAKKQDINLNNVPGWIVSMDSNLDPRIYILETHVVFVGSKA